MANFFFAAALLSGILAVSGCAGQFPGSGAYGYGGGGGYPSYGGGQGYPYNPGAGGGYAQSGQPYYQPQVYSGDSGVYAYQAGQVPQATGEYNAPAPGRWSDQRHQYQEDRIQRGLASGQLTPEEANRLRGHQGRFGGVPGQMGANGNPSLQGQGRLNGMPQRSAQGIYGQSHLGVPTGPTAQSGPTRPTRPMAQVRPAGQPRATMQPRTAVQPRPATPRGTTSQPRQSRYNGSAI